MIRRLSTTSCLMIRRLAKRSNPGIGHQINAIEDAAKIIQSDPEGFEGLESDLFNAHQSHKEHEFDLKRQSEKIRRYIVKNRYFKKDSLPNLLTYAEKEHIKFLHSCDEEEWTVEKLAESFPANAEIIRKILKARWSAISLKRVQSHDASVMKNWARFNNGEYKENMSTELYEHLKKFANRKDNKNLSIDSTQMLRKKQWQKPISNEFVSIITSLKPKRSVTEHAKMLDAGLNVKKLSTDCEDNETYLLGKISNKKLITIHELKKINMLKTTQELISNNLKCSLDNSAAQELKKSSEKEIVSGNKCTSTNVAPTDYTEKFIKNEIIISEFDRNQYDMSATKHRICIPRKYWRKGATYRIHNCYYDDDGEFLYKIPDLSSQ